MTTHLEQELEVIKSRIFEMADLTIESIAKSVDSIKKSDIKMAEEVINGDNRLDDLEIEIDNECIRILVTKQPAAIHMRLVLSLLKINTDLERIGDLAANISKESININKRPIIKPLVDIPRMKDICIEMMQDVFNAFTEKDVEKAKTVIERDNEIDELNLQIYRELYSYMAEKPSTISQSLSLIMVSKALERIGDHVTNIAERTVFYIEGVDIRHSHGDSDQ